MELRAAIEALGIWVGLGRPDVSLQLYTDSAYVFSGSTAWARGWKERGWKTAAGRPVANQDLWQELPA